MASSRNKPQFRPPASQEQLNELIQQFNAALKALDSRLGITEFAVNQLIQDVYAEDEPTSEDVEEAARAAHDDASDTWENEGGR